MTQVAPLSVFTEMIMGLPFSLHLHSAADPDKVRPVVEQVWASLRTADATFSTYRTDSAISRLNRAEPFATEDQQDIDLVLGIAEHARVITEGAFDVHYSDKLDPSGIVKGWAAGRAAEFLRPLEAAYYLNAGGDIVLHTSRDHPTWRIGIEHPLDPTGLLAVLELPAGAVATSGSAHRGNHIIDPRTRRPASGFAQVTVVGPSLVIADVAATALMVTGTVSPAMSEWLDGYEILGVTRGSEIIATEGMAELIVTELPPHQTF